MKNESEFNLINGYLTYQFITGDTNPSNSTNYYSNISINKHILQFNLLHFIFPIYSGFCLSKRDNKVVLPDGSWRGIYTPIWTQEERQDMFELLEMIGDNISRYNTYPIGWEEYLYDENVYDWRSIALSEMGKAIWGVLSCYIQKLKYLYSSYKKLKDINFNEIANEKKDEVSYVGFDIINNDISKAPYGRTSSSSKASEKFSIFQSHEVFKNLTIMTDEVAKEIIRAICPRIGG